MFLKRTTPYNIVIGGAAGAFPPLIGWAVSTNTIAIESFLLFLLIFMDPSTFLVSLSYNKERLFNN